MPDIVALGELLIDFVHKDTNEYGYPIMHANPGGAPCNFLCAAASCGASTAFIGKVGDDAFGHLLIKTLKEHRIDTSGVTVDPSVFTTLAFVTLDESGDRNFSFARKPGADTMLTKENLRYTLLRNTRVFHFGTLSDESEAADQMLWGIKHADVVKISEEEIKLLLNESVEEGARRLVEKFDVKLVLATMGKKGVFFANKNASGLVFAFTELPTVDTTGAGDIFGGSAVYKLLKTGKQPDELTCEELTEICRFANAMAGISTTRSGGLPSVPTRAEAEAFLKEQNL